MRRARHLGGSHPFSGQADFSLADLSLADLSPVDFSPVDFFPTVCSLLYRTAPTPSVCKGKCFSRPIIWEVRSISGGILHFSSRFRGRERHAKSLSGRYGMPEWHRVPQQVVRTGSHNPFIINTSPNTLRTPPDQNEGLSGDTKATS